MTSVTVKINDVFITNTFYNGLEELRVCPETIYKGNAERVRKITFGDVVTDNRVVAGILQRKITFDDLFTGKAHTRL